MEYTTELSYQKKIIELEEKIIKLTNELTETKEHLKKYTAPSRSKTFYDNHREEILEKKRTDPKIKEQRKETNKKAYLKRKELLKETKNIKENNVVAKTT